MLFRRALKIVNGAIGQLPADGLTIVAENPVYVQGNYNAGGAGFPGSQPPAAIMADAVTLLSNNWLDALIPIAQQPGQSPGVDHLVSLRP